MKTFEIDFWSLYKDGYRNMYNEAIKRGRADIAHDILKLLKNYD